MEFALFLRKYQRNLGGYTYIYFFARNQSHHNESVSVLYRNALWNCFGGRKLRATFPRNSATALPRTKTSLSLSIKICTKRMGRRKRARRRFASLLPPSHGSLRFVTSPSRFALASMRNTKRLRRRQVTDHKKVIGLPKTTVQHPPNLTRKMEIFFPFF